MGNRHLTYFNKMTVEIKDALSEYSVLRRNALITRTTSAKTGDMDAVDRSQFGRKGGCNCTIICDLLFSRLFKRFFKLGLGVGLGLGLGLGIVLGLGLGTGLALGLRVGWV